MELLHKLYGADDGACNQLREEAEVEAKVQEILNRGNLPAFDVHYITHRLEGEE